MDMSPDVWGQLALEASQVYLTDGTAARSPFYLTVMWRLQIKKNILKFMFIKLQGYLNEDD